MRAIIEKVSPEIDCGRFCAKRRVGEEVCVEAQIFADGHQQVSARLLYRFAGTTTWQRVPMQRIREDRWRGRFLCEDIGLYHYTLEAWVDGYRTWQLDLQKKAGARQDLSLEFLIGAQLLEEGAARASESDAFSLRQWALALKNERLLELALDPLLCETLQRYPSPEEVSRYPRELTVVVDPRLALFSTWYELFPRSASPDATRPGTLRDCEDLVPRLAEMGFDVLYLPPIHPIGTTNRRGKDNSPTCEEEGDPGSPWAIGSKEGGHKTIDPALGTLEDFDRLVRKAREQGVEIALDLAFQCSPDHPYVQEHPDWFLHRPDGSIQYAENPPKKYEDILPLAFDIPDRQSLWNELKDIVLFWIGHGVRLFRADNPHTKAFRFWEWLIGDVKKTYPDVLFLSEAFTRPSVMYYLSKVGFSQSYTYFTWRNTKQELTDYLIELTHTDKRDFFLPHFWPNTPDILPEFLQYGGHSAFAIRLILAATLSSSYGLYGPPYEHCLSDALPGKEEYLRSEKYEIRHWSHLGDAPLSPLIAQINRIRRENPALQSPWNLRFGQIDNDHLLYYIKATPDGSNALLIVVTLDPFQSQEGRLHIPLEELGLPTDRSFLLEELLSGNKYIWQGPSHHVEINPQAYPACLFRLRGHVKRENSFDYFA